MATVVWDQLIQKPIDDDKLKVALCLFEIRHKKIELYEKKIFKLTLKINRMQSNSQAYDQMESKIESINGRKNGF